jgi:hypothetical protein
LAAADWADLVYGSDPRFAELVPDNGGSLADFAEALVLAFGPTRATADPEMPLPTGAPSYLAKPGAIRKWLDDIHSRARRLEALSLEDLLSDLFEGCSTARGTRRDALLARLGWAGKPPITLEEAGHLLGGLTRERIRQLESGLRQRFPPPPLYLPALSKAIQLLVETAPLEIDTAAKVLHMRGISNATFSPESILAAADDLGVDPPLKIAATKGVRMITRAANTVHVEAILVVARKKAAASGVASAHDIAASVSSKSGLGCSVEDVVATLNACRRFRHLLGPWYWATDVPVGRNRLVNVCTNMLSVTAPISIARLRDGVKREYMFRNLSRPGRYDLRIPPADVLRHFLRDHPDFTVHDDDGVRLSKPVDYRQQLGVGDQVLVDVLRSSPSTVLDRASIIRDCAARGINPQTVNVSLTYSCLVEHVDTNIWTLRGSEVSPTAVEALRQANALRPREKRVRDFGWTADGCLWVAAVVPPATQQFTFSCPAGSRPYLAGQMFSAVMHDSTPCGTVRVTEAGIVHGFSAFQQVSGCDSGDIVVVVFNLGEQVATLMLGDEELLDRYTS